MRMRALDSNSRVWTCIKSVLYIEKQSYYKVVSRVLRPCNKQICKAAKHMATAQGCDLFSSIYCSDVNHVTILLKSFS